MLLRVISWIALNVSSCDLGTVIAVYRIAHDGWTSQEARDEADRYGMHEWAAGMKNYIHEFHLRQTRVKPSRGQ